MDGPSFTFLAFGVFTFGIIVGVILAEGREYRTPSNTDNDNMRLSSVQKNHEYSLSSVFQK
jgi:hypothetical protein